MGSSSVPGPKTVVWNKGWGFEVPLLEVIQ